jgi:hypothetical protein
MAQYLIVKGEKRLRIIGCKAAKYVHSGHRHDRADSLIGVGTGRDAGTCQHDAEQ